jgi:uncharacterized membrane protein SirB2
MNENDDLVQVSGHLGTFSFALKTWTTMKEEYILNARFKKVNCPLHYHVLFLCGIILTLLASTCTLCCNEHDPYV